MLINGLGYHMGADGFAVGPTYAQLGSLYVLSTLDIIDILDQALPLFLSDWSKVMRRIICVEEGEPSVT